MVDTSSAAALCYVRWGGGGGSGHPYPETNGGPVSKENFFGPSGGGGEGTPLDPPLTAFLVVV